MSNKKILFSKKSDDADSSEYLAAAVSSGVGRTPGVFLLDHSTPGSLSLASVYSVVSGFESSARASDKLRFSPDSNFLATNFDIFPYFTILNHSTPGLLSEVSVPNTLNLRIRDVDFTSDNKFVAISTASGSTGQVQLYKQTSIGELLLVATYSDQSSRFIDHLQFSPDGNYLAIGSTSSATSPAASHGFRLLDTSTKKSLISSTASIHLSITYSLVWSRDGNYIVTGQSLRNVQLLDHTTPGTLTLAATYVLGGSTNVGKVDISPDGKYIACAQIGTPYFTLLNHTIPGTLTLAATYNIGAQVTGVAFNRNGDYIAASTFSSITLLNHTIPGSLSLATTYAAGATDVKFSPIKQTLNFTPDVKTGAFLATAGSSAFTQKFYDATYLAAPKLTSAVPISTSMNTIAASPDGKTIYMGGITSQVFARNNPDILEFKQSIPSSVDSGASFSPTNTHFVACSSSTLRLYTHNSPGSLTQVATYTLSGSGNGTSFSPNGNYIAVTHTSAPYFTLLNHTTPGTLTLAATYTLAGGGRSVYFSPDGNYIAVGHLNSPYFTLLNHTTPGAVSLLTTYTLAGAPRDKRGIVIADDNTIIVGHTGNTNLTLLDHSSFANIKFGTTANLSSDVNSVALFHPSGNIFAINLSPTNRIDIYERSSNTISLSSSLGLVGITVIDSVRPNVQTRPATEYGTKIALAHAGTVSSTYFTLLDHTQQGNVNNATFVSKSAGPGVSLDFSPDNNYLALKSTTAPTFRLFSRNSPGQLTLSSTYSLSSSGGTGLRFSHDGNYIAVSSQSVVTLLNHTTPGNVTLSATYTVTGTIQTIEFSPDDKYIAVGHVTAPYLTLLNHTTPGSLSLATTYTTARETFSAKFSPDGNTLFASFFTAAAAPFGRIVKLNHSVPGTLSFVSNVYLNLGHIRALDLTPDGEYLVAADSLSNVWLLNSNLQIMSRSDLNVFPEPLTLGIVNAVRFSPDGKYIGVAHSNTPYYFALLDHTNPGSISIITSYKLPGAVNPEGLAFSYN